MQLLPWQKVEKATGETIDLTSLFSDCPKGVVIIISGARGVTWAKQTGELSRDNPLMFTCTLCKIHSDVLFEPGHTKNCRFLLMNRLGI